MKSTLLILPVSMNNSHANKLFLIFLFCVTMFPPVAWPHLSILNHITHSSPSPSDKGLNLETTGVESLYGAQFTLSTYLMKLDYLGISMMQHQKFTRNLSFGCLVVSITNISTICREVILLRHSLPPKLSNCLSVYFWEHL